MDATRVPLRMRKKAKIREALIATSFRLFSERGYTETTLEQICDECDVTVQTLLRYFGSKDDLLFANHAKILERFTIGILQAARRNASIEYWLKFLRSNLLQLEDDKVVRQTYRIITGSPSLLSRFYAIARQYRVALEHALSEEAGARPGEDIYSSLLAQIVVMAPIEEALRCVEQGETDHVVERCDRIAAFALQNFRRPTQPEPKSASGPKRVRAKRAK